MRPSVELTRVDLSIGSFDLIRFDDFRHEFPRHVHDDYTIGVFERSAGSIQYRNASWHAVAGNVLIIPPNEVHAATPERDAGWSYRSLYPSCDVMRLANEDRDCAFDTGFTQPVIDDSEIAAKISALHVLLEHGMNDLHAEELLLTVCRQLVSRHASHREHARIAASANAVQRARDYIETHFATPIRLAQLSQAAGLSAFHLLRCYRDTYGLPPHAHLTQVRAGRARERLLRGEPISAVAYSCGFADQSHLTRVFRAIYGVTPGQYRKLGARNT